MGEQDQPSEPSQPTFPSMPYSPHDAPTYATSPVSKPPEGQRARSPWSRLSPGKRATLVGAVLVLLIGGSAGSFALLQHALGKPDGYLWTDATEVVFVQLTEDQSGHITGSWHMVQETSDLIVTSEDEGFTGSADGSRLTLTFSALGFSSSIAGTLGGNTLTLQVPDQNGYIATDVFHGASVQDYNTAAAQLRQYAATQLAAAQSAQATAVAQDASAQATAAAQAAAYEATASAAAAAPPVATLPFTLTGQTTPSFDTDQFTAPVQWHYTARCVNPPTDNGAPYALTVRVDQPSDATISGYAQVGQQLDMSCDGTTVDSNTVQPGGYPPGSYGWDVVTGGNWTITVLRE